MASAAQVSAFLQTRPDIRSFIQSNRPDVAAQGDSAIVSYWWTNVLTGPGTADWVAKQRAGGSLDTFLSGAGARGGTSAQQGQGGTDQITRWFSANAPLSYVIAGLGALVLLRRK